MMILTWSLPALPPTSLLTIIAYFQNEENNLGFDGPELVITSARSHHAGLYICSVTIEGTNFTVISSTGQLKVCPVPGTCVAVSTHHLQIISFLLINLSRNLDLIRVLYHHRYNTLISIILFHP